MSVDNPFTHAIIPYGYGIGSESGENDSQMKRLFIIMFLLVLVVLAVFQATKIAEANKKLDRVLSSNKKLEIYMNQQMWLYDAALTANPDDSLLDPALTWLKVLQERRRKSLPAEGTSVSIVQIPEILLKEHQVFSWQIYVPEDKAVELYAFSGPEEPSSEITEASGFRHQLPAGSSSVSLQLRGRYDRTWGNSVPREQRPKRNCVEVEASINDNVIWKQTIADSFSIYQRVTPFDSPTIVLNEDSWTELFHKPPFNVRLKLVKDKDGAQ